MWIVRLALRRPYTFVVMSLAILLLGVTAIITMPVDIFPYIDIPVVSVVWNYSGMSPEEMENRILTVFERGMTTTVNDIEHIESQSYYGVSVVHVYFQPNVKVDMAMAQITAPSQLRHARHAAGDFSAQHPQVRRFQRAHPAIGPGKQNSERAGNSTTWRRTSSALRWPRFKAPRFRAPTAASSARWWWISIRMRCTPNSLSAIDVSNAFNLQNLILPAGTIKIGDTRVRRAH